MENPFAPNLPQSNASNMLSHSKRYKERMKCLRKDCLHLQKKMMELLNKIMEDMLGCWKSCMEFHN